MKRFRFLLVPALVAAAFALTMVAPVSWCERISSHHWELQGAWLFEGSGQDVLLVHLFSLGRGRGASFSRFMTFDPADGRLLGTTISDDHPKVLGVDGKRLWLREYGLGSSREESLVLPDLFSDPVMVRVPVNSVWKRDFCSSAPRPPRMLGDDLLLDATYACDMRRGELFSPGDGERVLLHQTLQDEKGKLLISRLNTAGQMTWTLGEPDWCGQVRGRDENGYRVEWSTAYRDLLIFALPQDEDVGDFYLLAIQPDAGAIAWQHHVD